MSTWEDIPMTLCSETGLAGQPSMEEFQQTFDIVFVDVTGFTNICLGMTSSFYKRVGCLPYKYVRIVLLVVRIMMINAII